MAKKRPSRTARFLVASRIVICAREPLLEGRKLSAWLPLLILDVLALALTLLAAAWVGRFLRVVCRSGN